MKPQDGVVKHEKVVYPNNRRRWAAPQRYGVVRRSRTLTSPSGAKPSGKALQRRGILRLSLGIVNMTTARLPDGMTIDEAMALPYAPIDHFAWGVVWVEHSETLEFWAEGRLWRLRKSPQGEWHRVEM